MEGDILASSICVEPKLSKGVVDCKGLPRCQWITKFVLIKDNDGESLALGVYHSVCPKLVVGMRGRWAQTRLLCKLYIFLFGRKE
jgi:hypothetical protein